MSFVTRKTLFVLTLLACIAVLGIGAFIWSGFYNVGADHHHTPPVHAMLATMRDRSIATRARRLQVPDDLLDPARIVQGAGNYDAMCMGCHLAPGMADTELSRGLYPAPPNLSRESVDAAQAFWVIKHGIKASGMPGWGGSMDDVYIWNMAAFLQELPNLGPEQYQAMVASSGGHDHGGGETRPHDHAPGTQDDHHGTPAARSPASPHAHPPGTPANHHGPAAKPMQPSSAAAEPVATRDPPSPPVSHDDDHDHQH